MYIDSKKFDYSRFSYPEADVLVERDKQFVRDAYCNWINTSVAEIVERQWQIDDVGVIEQVGDFIKLLKEAEFTYSIGAFTSSIALAGVCAEDLCRFFATSAGHNLDSETQANRVEKLLRLGAINQSVVDKFNSIRRLRNDCLHFNDGFKQKNIEVLRVDALNAVNTLKSVYAEIMGVVDYSTLDPSKFAKMIDVIATEAVQVGGGALGLDGATAKMRNLFGKVFGLDLSMNNDGATVYKMSIYEIQEIDGQNEPVELTLRELNSGLIVIVDLSAKELIEIRKLKLKEGDVVAVSLMSSPDSLGLTRTWRLCTTPKKIN